MNRKSTDKLNCWEFMHCGREKGGEKTAELGVCQASSAMTLHQVHGGQHCGRACWVMEGTLCAASVQGPFLEKFKKCIRCPFFHYVEAQEGKQLKNVNELLQLMAQNDKISKAAGKTEEPQGPMAVCKGCGQELRFSMDPGWAINIIGMIEFQCRNCGQIIRTRDLLSEEPEKTITLNLK